MFRLLTTLIMVVFIAGSQACAGDVDVDSAHSSGGIQVVVAAQSSENCTKTNNGLGEFPGQLSHLVLTVQGQDVDFRTDITTQPGKSGNVLVEHVPPGENLTLSIYGCDESNAVAWSGRTQGLTLKANDKVGARLFFTKKGEFNCPGSNWAVDPGFTANPLPARAFGQLVATKPGHALFVGGFDTTEVSNELELKAGGSGTGSILEYRTAIGMFRKWDAELIVNRGAHHTVVTPSKSHIFVLGGMKVAQVAASDQTFVPVLPLAPPLGMNGSYDSELLPTPSIEVIDVAKKTVTASPLENTVYPLSAAGLSADASRIDVSGGLQPDGTVSLEILRFDASLPKILSAESVVQVGALSTPRVGHTATALPNGTMVLIGGNVDGSKDRVLEVIRAESTAGQLVILTLNSETVEPFALHETALVSQSVCQATLLVAGGVNLIPNPGGPVQIDHPEQGSDRLLLVHVNTCTSEGTIENLELSSLVTQYSGYFKRAFHTLTDLGDNVFMLGGGYRSVEKLPRTPPEVCDPDEIDTGCFVSNVLLLRLSEAGDKYVVSEAIEQSPKAYTHPRFGHSDLVLSDGTLLVAGGLRSYDLNPQLNSTALLSGDAQIYNAFRSDEAGLCAPE